MLHFLLRQLEGCTPVRNATPFDHYLTFLPLRAQVLSTR